MHGIQLDGTCPLLVMLPFTDKRSGPPEWATHHIEIPSGFENHARSLIDQTPETHVEYWDDNQGEELYGFGWWPSAESLSKAAFSWLASAQLAIEHFNDRDPSVVSLLAEQEFQRCPITFSNTSLFVDTEYHRSSAFDRALQVSLSNPICAVIGPETYDAVQAVSYITEGIKIPQVAYGTIDERLTNAESHPSLARPTTDNHEFTEAIIQYLQRNGKRRDYVALIHDLEQYGEQIEHTIFEVLDKYGLQLTHHHIVHDDPNSALNAMDFVRQDGFHTFILATDQTAFLDRIAEAADSLGLIGEEYFYAIIDLTLPSAKLSSIHNEVDSPLDKLLRGAALFRILEPFQYKSSDEDRFLNSWTKQGNGFVGRVNALHPFAKKGHRSFSTQDPEHFVASEGHFQDAINAPSPLSSFIYDSVMLVGISACRIHSSSSNQSNGKEKYLSSHLEAILQTEFDGASGKLKFTDGENSRLYDGIVFGTYNILPGVVDEMSGRRGYNYTLTSINSGSGWEDVEGTEFKFFNGKPDQPMPLLTEPDNHYFYITIIIGSIAGSALVISLVYLAYKRYKNYQRIRKAHEQLMEATLNESIRALHELDYPLHLIRGDEFETSGKLIRHEKLRNLHKLFILDSLADVDDFIAGGKNIVFFSHQWTSFTAPDPTNTQYKAMVKALRKLVTREGWDEDLKNTYVWVDFGCIPQANPSTQNLAIRSLAAYASSATYFVICAPDTKHSDLIEMCDLDTYQRRMWCRAEQVCHSLRNGIQGMYLAEDTEEGLRAVPADFFKKSLRVFNGELTCCRLEHKSTGTCDRQSLVVPLLGLYGELFRASVEGIEGGNKEAMASVQEFLDEIEINQEDVFPRTFLRTSWRKNKRIIERVTLFGDLIERMKARVKSGAGFDIDAKKEMNTANANEGRRSSSAFLRHGVVHGAPRQGRGSHPDLTRDCSTKEGDKSA